MNTQNTPNIPSPEKNSVWDRLKGLVREPEPTIDFQSQKQAISGYKAATASAGPQPAAVSVPSAVPPSPVPSPSAAAIKPPAAEGSSAFKRFVSPREQWHAPKVLKTNLIRDELTTFVNWGRQGMIAAAVVFLAVAIVGAVYGGLIYWQKQVIARGDVLQEEVKSLKAGITEGEQGLDEVKHYEARVALASGLLDRHIYYGNVLEFLETHLLPEVYITGGLNGDTSGTFSFSIQAPSYATIAEQVEVFRSQPLVIRAYVDSGSLAKAKSKTGAPSDDPGQRTVGFSLALEIDPAIFKYDSR